MIAGLLKVLGNVQVQLESLILKTANGERRNRLTEANILIAEAMQILKGVNHGNH